MEAQLEPFDSGPQGILQGFGRPLEGMNRTEGMAGPGNELKFPQAARCRIMKQKGLRKRDSFILIAMDHQERNGQVLNMGEDVILFRMGFEIIEHTYIDRHLLAGADIG
ncbi:MAG: hypothetical protein UZ16_OP3001001651, partial [Candidatus Hinthialibacteria bacterium OLB16]